MKYSRWRIFAVALLSVTMAVLLSGLGVLLSFNPRPQADQDQIAAGTTFASAYKFTPITTSGQISLGQNKSLTTTFALRDESYRYGALTDFLHLTANEIVGDDGNVHDDIYYVCPKCGRIYTTRLDKCENKDCDGIKLEQRGDAEEYKGSYYVRSNRQGFSTLATSHSYGMFSDADLQSIIQGTPVNDYGISYEDNNKNNEFDYIDINNNGQYDIGEEVEGDRFVSYCVKAPIVILDTQDADSAVVFELLNLPQMPISFSMKHNNEPIKTREIVLESGQKSDLVYDVDSNTVAYSRGANISFRGLFNEEGLYEFEFELTVIGDNNMFKTVNLNFSFHIVSASRYTYFPKFSSTGRIAADGEIYHSAYNGEYPEIDFNSNYFAVTINNNRITTENNNNINNDYKVSTIMDGPEDFIGNLAVQFYNVGDYHMVSRLKYNYTNRQSGKTRNLYLDQYQPYDSLLSIKGYQGFYGETNPFYNPDDESENCDITSWVKTEGLQIPQKNPDANNTRAYASNLIDQINSRGLQPIRTNFPPVQLLGNIDHAYGYGADGNNTLLSTVSYRAIDDTQWQKPRTIQPGEPYSDAGTYLILIYYWVNNTLCQQTFYFEIINTIELKFAINDGETIVEFDRLNEIEADTTISSKGITILYNDLPQLGRFEVQPTLRLTKAELDNVLVSHDVKLHKDETTGALKFDLEAGCYRFIISYGAYSQATAVINLVVDNTSAKDIVAQSNVKQVGLDKLPDNVAVYGNGEVGLSWAQKTSGIAFDHVDVTHYRLVLENSKLLIDPNKNVNYEHYNEFDNHDLYTASSFFEEKYSQLTYIPKLRDGRWVLEEKFTLPGLYHFVITDLVGNATDYFLFIDDSAATFVQDSTEPTGYTNVVTEYDDTKGVRVGFGTHKLIKANASVINGIFGGNEAARKALSTLQQEQILVAVDEYAYALRIPLANVEMNNNSGAYAPIEERNAGFVTLREEGTYYLRVTDQLANISEYYIMLTHDYSCGLVYSESVAKEITNPDDKPRGYVAAEPDLDTAFVTTQGGMTNRNYLTFTFTQEAASEEDYRVQSIKMEYYRFDWENKSSANYPFAEESYPYLNYQDNNGYLYQDIKTSSNRLANGPYRLALYNKRNDGSNTYEPTRRGLYIITRTYEHLPTGSADQYMRKYYFIVDDQAMLYYAADVYASDLLVRFGSDNKIAGAADFDANDYVLSSNRKAEVGGYLSKYGSTNHSSGRLTFFGLNFPALMPRFSYINNGQTINLGVGMDLPNGSYAVLGDENTGDNVYQLIVADDARSFSIGITNGSITELKNGRLTSANYSVLTLKLDTGYGTNATLTVNGNTFGNSHMTYDIDSGDYYYVLDPENLNELKFQFESDPDSFYANVDVPATTNSWVATGFGRSIALNYTRDDTGTQYQYDIFEDFLRTTVITNGSSVTVNLITEDGESTLYHILFKLNNNEPTTNLRAIKEQDNLAQNMTFDELPTDYIYGLAEDFIFQIGNPEQQYLDTKLITYREVDSSGKEGSAVAVPFSLKSGIAFSKIVGLRPNEMKFFRITETDYAGHHTDYIVQIQGVEYNGDITYIGTTSQLGSNTVIGIDMRVSSSSAHQFYLNNKSFKFVNTDDNYQDEYYMVLNGTSYWRLNGVTGSNPSSETELVNTLNKWLDRAASRGEKCSYILYDRMGEPESFECYSLPSTAAKLEIQAYNLIPESVTASPVYLETMNYDELSPILKMEALRDRYKLEIIDIATNIDIAQNIKFEFDLTATTLYNITKGQELIIRLTDPFQRVSVTEYHGQDEIGLIFTPYGNTRQIGDTLYVGDSRGVTFQYLRDVYLINVYNAQTMVPVASYDIALTNNGKRVTYTFKPSSFVADTSNYIIEAVGKSSNAVLWSRNFAFDTRLPNAIWTDAIDNVIDINNASLSGTVNLRIAKNNLPFETTLSYTRTSGYQTQRVTLPSDVTTYQFNLPGQYEVTLRNEIWAAVTYTFEITETGSALAVVYDDDKLLQPSSSSYQFAEINKAITTYVFTLEADPAYDDGTPYAITNYVAHGLSKPMPIDNGNRVLVETDENTPYYAVDEEHDTLIWRLAVPTSWDGAGNITGYTSDVFLATVGIPRHNLNDDNALSLVINDDDPITVYYNTHDDIRTPNNMPDQGLNIKLHPGKTLDSKGLACYVRPGNLVYVDCYRNGELVKTVNSNESIHIGKDDAGYYQFYIRDLVGNQILFGNGESQQNYYEILVLTKPLVTVNGDSPVNGMIYNDRVELSLLGVADKFLRQEYGAEDFAEYFKIIDLTVDYNGEELPMQIGNTQTTFVWDQAGTYQVKLKYQIGPNTLNTIDGTYNFQIVPSRMVMDSFSMNTYTDIDIVTIRRNGYLVQDYGEIVVGQPLMFTAQEYSGTYQIVLCSHDNITGDKYHSVTFNIGYKNSSLKNYFWLDTLSGQGTTATVNFSYQPQMLYYMGGTVVINIYRDNELIETRTIDIGNMNELNLSARENIAFSAEGRYLVQAFDADGDVIYSDSWSIVPAESSFGYMIAAGIGGVAVLGVIIFLRLRRKMKVK